MDYLDGNLSDLEIQRLEDFLLINPDLRTELEGTEKIILSPESIVFNQKEFLKQPDFSLPVNENNFEDFCIGSTEGDLNDQQHNELTKYTNEHHGSEKILVFYTRLHLTPDKNIVFPVKENLKKPFILIPREILYPILSVAAAVAFMLIIYFRKEDGTKYIPGIAADLPAAIIAKSPNDSQDVNKENIVVQKNKHIIQEASVIAFSKPKEKKRIPAIKAGKSLEKNNDENKNRNLLPPQRLNPSFQIKLPSMADNQIPNPTIDRAKITYAAVKATHDSPEYLSLSEYARKQLTEKVLGNKDPENTRLSAWQIANAGISGLNKITGGEMKLEKRACKDGSITSYSFNSKLLSFSTTAVK